MSELLDEVKSEAEIKNENIEEQSKLDELDYEEEIDESKPTNGNRNGIRTSNEDQESDDGAIEDDSDGELKSDHDGDEVKGQDEVEIEKPPATPEEEEDGEINDGEKVKKAFIPRVPCKYYQRGKCTWGRTCKFLHPGVNDTGNYSFLEFQDPNAKVYQQKIEAEASVKQESVKEAAAEAVVTESAWERGLRHAREMKEKAKQRKLAEKDQFDDKKMNLSLKEFELEKENDERYFNVVKVPDADEDEDEDLHLFAQSGRIDRGGPSQAPRKPDNQYRSYDDQDSRRSGQYSDYRSRQANDYRTNERGTRRDNNSPFRGNNRHKADDWHDPWDRSRVSRKEAAQRSRDRSNSYSSSGSDSRSRSRSGSRSSYSSGSSRSYSSRSSDSSRSGSRDKKKSSRDKKATNPKQLTNDLKKKIESLKNKTAKPLPGRQISDISLKKAGLDNAEKSSKKTRKAGSRSRSNSSASSYGSSDSKSDNDDDLTPDSDSFSDSNDDYSKKNKSKKTSLKAKGQKRPAQESGKIGSDSKKSKIGGHGGDKKQMIKDQLKLLESALKKKSMTK